MRRRPGLLLVILCLLTACSSEKPPLAFGVALHGAVTAEAMERAAALAGVTPSLVIFYVQWPGEPRAEGFPAACLETAERAGAVACVTWEPMSVAGDVESAVPAGRILSGEYDPYIDHFARAARDFGRPLILRFAHEMNLARYHWGTSAEEYGPASPDLYKRMFRHVRQRFRAQGAGNVLFAFCPNAESIPAAPWNTLEAWFPGADEVDVLGMDGYDWGRTRTQAEHGWDSSPRSFVSVFKTARKALLPLDPGAPLLVFETSSADAAGKAEWLASAVKTSEDWGLAGLVWFQAEKEADWRLPEGGVPERLRDRLAAPRTWRVWLHSLAIERRGG